MMITPPLLLSYPAPTFHSCCQVHFAVGFACVSQGEGGGVGGGSTFLKGTFWGGL